MASVIVPPLQKMTPPAQITPFLMFLTFAKIGLSGFGGVMPFVYAEIVEKKKWLSNVEFSEMIAMGQLLPGANVTNFAAMFGYRLAGWRGVFASLAGLLSPPAVVIYVLYQVYQSDGAAPAFQGALRGILAATSALVFVTGYKMARAQKSGRVSLIFGLLALLAVGIFSFPLWQVLIVLAPLSFLLQWKWPSS